MFYIYYTVCPEISDPFYTVSYYIKWVTTSWTYSTMDRTKSNVGYGAWYIYNYIVAQITIQKYYLICLKRLFISQIVSNVK